MGTVRGCAFYGCVNKADPRWGAYCDGHGVATDVEWHARAEQEAALMRGDIEDLKQHSREVNARLNAVLDVLTAVERGPLLADCDTAGERMQMWLLWAGTVRAWAREAIKGDKP